MLKATLWVFQLQIVLLLSYKLCTLMSKHNFQIVVNQEKKDHLATSALSCLHKMLLEQRERQNRVINKHWAACRRKKKDENQQIIKVWISFRVFVGVCLLSSLQPKKNLNFYTGMFCLFTLRITTTQRQKHSLVWSVISCTSTSKQAQRCW